MIVRSPVPLQRVQQAAGALHQPGLRFMVLMVRMMRMALEGPAMVSA